MLYGPFHADFPEIAKRETRMLTISDDYDGNLPAGSYALFEYYCTTTDCDCRRVMLHVLSDISEGYLAVINFGWESRKFYEDWFGGNDNDWIHELKGPSLNTSSPQSLYANELLTILSEQILQDKAYIDSLKRHYSIFKDKIKKTRVDGIEPFQKRIQSPSVGRNDPCPCGSGLKHKKCCGS